MRKKDGNEKRERLHGIRDSSKEEQTVGALGPIAPSSQISCPTVALFPQAEPRPAVELQMLVSAQLDGDRGDQAVL